MVKGGVINFSTDERFWTVVAAGAAQSDCMSSVRNCKKRRFREKGKNVDRTEVN